MDTYTPHTADFPRGEGRVTNLLEALSAVGKQAAAIEASLYTASDFAPLPTPGEGDSILYRVAERWKHAQVLVVENLNNSLRDTGDFLRRVAAHPEQYRDHFPALETVLFI